MNGKQKEGLIEARERLDLPFYSTELIIHGWDVFFKASQS